MRQLNKTKRRLCLGTFVLVAAPVLLASVASACTQLANLQANPNSGAAGSSISVTGSRFRTEATAGPVEVRLDSRSGAPIATLPVSSINSVGGTITMPVTIPAAASIGYHTLIATQFNTSTGALLSGFPVRATYRVTAAAASKDSSVAPVAEATTAEPAAVVASPAAAPAAPAAVTAPVATGPAATSAAPATASASPAVALAAATAATAASPADLVPARATDPATTPAAPASASTTTETGALLDATPAVPAQTVTAGLMASAAGSSASVLPTLTLALGAAVVLLSLLAFLKSGRTILGRRLTSLA